MATKSQRILDLLPGTFAAQPAFSPLQTLVRTYGGELQGAENAMAAIMRAHWCDQADLGANALNDLPRIASLYGLQPHPEDDIEEFRRRLKLWVRLILDGPTTVRGLLRASSILTGLEIDDSDPAFDPWWGRESEFTTTTRFSGRDAGPAIFGFDRGVAEGADAIPALIRGRVPLPDTLALSGANMLYIAVDGAPAQTVDLAAAPPVTTPTELVSRINDTLGTEIARLSGTRLELLSPSTGNSGLLELDEGPDDAAPDLLGLPGRTFAGQDATGAALAGSPDLSTGVDLSTNRYIRLRIDASHLAEIDCAGAAPEATTLAEIVAAINAALGIPVASHDGQFLRLQSPTLGTGSSIGVLTPAAQDATGLLFGPVPTILTGTDARPATLTGIPDLSTGVDLSTASTLLISYDGESPVEIDCAGEDPARTQLPEIVASLNAALRADIARENGRNLILSGLQTGPAGQLVIGQAETGDAGLALLGLPPRRAMGQDAVPARLRGLADLSAGLSLAARPILQIATDRRPPRRLDLSEAAAGGPLDALAFAAAISALPDAPLAAAEDDRLVLQSPGEGAAGRIELLPVTEAITRRFVSHVPIAEDAAERVLGTLSATVSGEAPTSARLQGTQRLTRGADLAAARYIRLGLDGTAPIDIDCAGPRPRNTTGTEIRDAINAALGSDIATLDADDRLLLASQTQGETSRITLSMPQASDAIGTLLGTPPTTALGQAARRVSFAGTVDLSAGVDLSTAARLSLAVDGGAPVEIDCSGPDPAATTPGQIAIAINVAMGINIASHDGRHILLTSPSAGPGSALSILAPASDDATQAILGVAPGRDYQGSAARAAEIVGQVALSGPVDLRAGRFLRIGVDTTAPVEIDCGAEAADPAAVSGADIVAAINAALPAPVAGIEDGRLVLRAPSPGPSSRIVLEATLAGDAAPLIFGEAPRDVQGTPGGPGVLTGTVDLQSGVDLSAHSVLRLVLDGGLPHDIDIAGARPDLTAPEEIVAAINAQLPDLAELTADGMLRLSAPAGATLALQPARRFELIDYPPAPVSVTKPGLRHGDMILIENTGAADVTHGVGIATTDGADAPGIVNIDSGWEVRMRGALPPDSRLGLSHGPDGPSITLETSEPEARANARVEALPLLPHLAYPRDETRAMARGTSPRRQMVLSVEGAPDLIQLTEIGQREAPPHVTLRAAQNLPETMPEGLWLGQLVTEGAGHALVDGAGVRLAGIALDPQGTALPWIGALVAVTGADIGPPGAPRILARRIDPLLDLSIATAGAPASGAHLNAVTLTANGPRSALAALNAADPDARIVFAEALDPADAFALPRGSGRRIYVDCLSARFDAAFFDHDRFAGGLCTEVGVFDASRFAETPRAASTPVFAPAAGGALADVTLNWESHVAGTAEINLPLAMPARFGARFDMDRFALADDAPESHAGLVTEPMGDPDHLTARLSEAGAASRLIGIRHVATVPIGFTALTIPYARPRALVGGGPDQAARLFLSDPGVPGFFEVSARLPGSHGNRIALLICDSGPGRFDALVSFDGARFENARARVLGSALTGTPKDVADPGPRGVLHLKAAGVQIGVTRDGTPPEETDC